MSEITFTPYEGMDEVYKEQRLRRQKGAAARALPSVLISEGYDIAPLFDPVPVSNEDRSKLMGDTPDPLKPGEKRVGGQQAIEDQYTRQQLGEQQTMGEATRFRGPNTREQISASHAEQIAQQQDLVLNAPGDYLRGVLAGRSGERVTVDDLLGRGTEGPVKLQPATSTPQPIQNLFDMVTGLDWAKIGTALATDPYTYLPGVGLMPLKGGPLTNKVIAGFNRLLTEERGATDLFGPGNVFQSQLSRIIQEKVNGPSSYEQISGMFKNNEAMQEEMKWTGLDEYLKGGKRDANDIQKYLSENAVQVQEVTRKYPPLNASVDERAASVDTLPLYSQYTLPGGKNYREVLLTLPAKAEQPVETRMGTGDKANYLSPHWNEPNILSHARLTDRTLADGRKVLFAEEVQSDWAHDISVAGTQMAPAERVALQARKEAAWSKFQEERKRVWNAVDPNREQGAWISNWAQEHKDRAYLDAQLAYEELANDIRAGERGVPDMPFKTNWHELTMKRLLRMAAEEGYDGLAWNTGKGAHATVGMGEEKAAGLYDRALPRFMGNYVKKWGGVVEQTRLPEKDQRGPWRVYDETHGLMTSVDSEKRAQNIISINAQGRNWTYEYKEGEDVLGPRAHVLPITPAMREGVLAGQPLFGNALSAVKEFVKGLPKDQIKDIAESVSKLPDAPKWVRDDLTSGESGRIHQGLAYMLGRMIAGGTLGSNMGETQDDRLRNALVGAGIGAFASPALVSKLRRAMRGTEPSAAKVEGATETTRPDLEFLNAGGQRIGIDFTKMQANPASVDQLVGELSGLYRDAAQQTGGPRYGLTPAPIPQALTARLAVQLGVTEEEMLNRLPGTALRPEELHAYADLHDLAWQRLRRLFTQWETAGNGDPALKEELKHQISMHYFLGSQMLGGGQIAGRSLNILGKPDVQAQMARARSFIGSIEGATGDLNLNEMGAIFRSIDQGTWAAAARAAQKASGWDMLAEIVYANTLSNPITWATNLFSGLVINPLFITIPARSLAEFKGEFKRAMGGTSGVAPGETVAAMHGYLVGNMKMIAAIRDAWDDSLNTAQPGRMVGQPDTWPGRWRAVIDMFDKVQALEPVGYSVAESTSAKPPALTGENFSALMKRHKLTAPYAIDPNGVIATGIDAYGVLARTLSKTPLDLGDRFAHAVNLEMANESLAVRKAFERGSNAAEIEALQEQYLEKLPVDIREEAERFAQHEIFKTPIEGFTGEVVKGLGHPAMRLFIEFVRTPWRIMTYTAEGLPIANRTVKYFQEEIAAGGARAELARAKVQVGSTFTAILFAAAFSDKITGYGPQNPEQRAVWLIDHQPFSVNVGTREKPHWLSFARLEPFASWAGLAADQAKAMQHSYEASPGEWENTIPAWTKDIVYGTPMNFAKQITNKTFTKDAFEAMSLLVPRNWEGETTFEKRMERYVENRARLLVPFGSALSAIESRQDPAVAEQRSAMDVLGSRLPEPVASWFGHTKVPLLDLFGKVVAHEDPYGLDQVSFVGQKHTQKDPVVDALNMNEVKPPRFPDYVGNVKTTAQELHDLKKLRADGPFGMEPLHKALEGVLTRQDFIDGTKGAQGYQNLALSKMIERYHDAAIKQYSLQHPKFGKLARTVTQAEQRGFIPKGSIKPEDFKVQ